MRGADERPLSEIAEVRNGFAFKSSDLVDVPEEGYFKVFKMGHIKKGGGFKPTYKTQYIEPRSAPDATKFGIAPGDILMSMTDMKSSMNLLGYSAYMDDGDGFLVNQRVGRIRPSEAINGRFLYYYLNSPDYIAAIRSTAITSVQVNLSTRAIRDSLVRVPTMETQTRIASILSAYDDLIENNRRRIQLLEEAARLFYEEWFVRFRFPGHEHAMITEGVPEGWGSSGMMEHPFFDLIHENIGSFDGLRRYYATADITGIFITGEGVDYAFEEKPSRAQKAPEVGSVWFARMQDTYKVLVFTETNRLTAEGSILSSGFAGFRARRPEFLPFLYLLINNNRFHAEKDRFCTGATQRSLTNGGLKSIQTVVPVEQVVVAFADTTTPLIDQILTLQALNEHLQEARYLLLPRLMNGEVTA